MTLTDCSNSGAQLRGRITQSPDGKTYLVVEDDYGCPTNYVDNRPWSHPKGMAGEIAPGKHRISCAPPSVWADFVVPFGTTFSFNYWGP
jgi:hypothetical protein